MRTPAAVQTTARALSVCLLAGLVAVVPAGGAGAEVRAGENYRLGTSTRAARAIDIPGLAVNPANPLHVVEVDRDFLNGECQYHVSFDGGITWTGGQLTGPAPFPSPPCRGGNPFDSGGYVQTNGSVAFGSGQTVYTTFSAKPDPPQRPESGVEAGPADSILVAKSTDGGRTFSPGVVVIPGPSTPKPYYIRPKLTVVPRPAGDQIVVAAWGVENVINTGAQGGAGGSRRTVTTVSNDGGATWSTPVDASGPGEQVREIGTPAIAPTGTMFTTWRNRDVAPSTNPVVVARSTNGGASWTRVPLTDSATYLATQANPISGAGGHPEIAVDPATGTVYAVYQGLTYGDLDIFLQRSTNDGVSWSAPVRVNDDPIGGAIRGVAVQQRQPLVTVAPGGRVDVVWHDRRNSYPANPLVSAGVSHTSARGMGDVYYAFSTDSGASFSPNRRISDRTMNLDVGLDARVGSSTWYGPASAPMGTDSVLVALPDSREGNYDTDNSDIYLSRLRLNATGPIPVRSMPAGEAAGVSVALSRMAYPGGLETQGNRAVTQVVIVNQGDAAAALAGAVLARDAWGPVLASPAGGLPGGVRDEVARLQAVGAFVIGDQAALSPAVVADLEAAGVAADKVERLAGTSPADTAGRIAAVLDTRSGADRSAGRPAFPAAVIVNPASPEAAAASGLAASLRLPVLFVERDSVPGPTSAALSSLNIDRTLVIGGPGAVSDAVSAGLPSPTRLGGADVYATSEAVVRESRARGLASNVVYVADGASPMDAAVMGAAVARLGGLVLLAPGAGATAATSSVERLGFRALVDRLVVQVPVPVSPVEPPVQPPPVPPGLPAALSGYRMVAADGGVFTFGQRSFHGSTGDLILNKPVVGGATDPSRHDGYWMVASDGGVFAFNAGFFGSLGGQALSAPAVEIEPTPTGGGYWIVLADGRVFPFGDARHLGDLAGRALNRPVIGMSVSSTGGGYWLVAADGGIFNFGDARFFGSTGDLRLNSGVVDLAPAADDDGYWLVAGDGGVFSFGSAEFKGSTGDLRLNDPVVAMLAAPDGSGYWMAASDGGLFTFGALPFLGSMGAVRLNSPVLDLIN